jgi:hypothetical protein
MVAQVYQYVIGRVTKVSGHGFIVEGHDGWLNLSKFAEPVPALPQVGAEVRVDLDKSGFVRAVWPTQLQEAEPQQPAKSTTAQSAQPHVSNVPPDKDRQIARMNALTNAVALVSTRPAGDEWDLLPEVLETAARMEEWVLRPVEQ